MFSYLGRDGIRDSAASDYSPIAISRPWFHLLALMDDGKPLRTAMPDDDDILLERACANNVHETRLQI